MISNSKTIRIYISDPNVTDASAAREWWGQQDDPVGWDPDSPEYYLNLTFAASEWLVGLSFVAYFATLAPDFKVLYSRIMMNDS